MHNKVEAHFRSEQLLASFSNTAVSIDTHGSWNSSVGKYTAPVDGYYQVVVGAHGISPTKENYLSLKVNGQECANQFSFGQSNAMMMQDLFMTAGDTVTVDTDASYDLHIQKVRDMPDGRMVMCAVKRDLHE